MNSVTPTPTPTQTPTPTPTQTPSTSSTTDNKTLNREYIILGIILIVFGLILFASYAIYMNSIKYNITFGLLSLSPFIWVPFAIALVTIIFGIYYISIGTEIFQYNDANYTKNTSEIIDGIVIVIFSIVIAAFGFTVFDVSRFYEDIPGMIIGTIIGLIGCLIAYQGIIIYLTGVGYFT